MSVSPGRMQATAAHLPCSGHIRKIYYRELTSSHRFWITPYRGQLRGLLDNSGLQVMIREFFAWWSAQLLDLLPRRLRQSAFSATDATVVSPIGPLVLGVEAITIHLRR